MQHENFPRSMATLGSAFDTVEKRKLPLSVRTPVTAALERLLYRVIEEARPDAFVEIGAYEAAFSRDMKTAYPDAEVLAVEANPRVFELFEGRAAAAGIGYVHKAVGEHPGVASFFIPEIVAGTRMPFAGRMGSLHQVAARDSELTEVQVEVTTLDALAEALPGESLCLWIDVEGAVDQVLRGGRRAVERAKILYCEVESAPFWKDQALADAVMAQATEAGFVPIARDCQKWFQYNVLFVKRELLEIPVYEQLVTRYVDEALALFSNEGHTAILE